MTKIKASILITNYNKSIFLKKTIKSCLKQKFKDKEILVFDDCSTDNSLQILDKFKKLKIIKNKKKKFKSSALNQIHALIEIFKKSKGEIIFLLDGDDEYKQNKLKYIYQIFKKNKNIQFIQDQPFLSDQKKNMKLKKKFHLFSIWPRFYPTSCITIRRKFFNNFLNYLSKNNFPNLEIDARLSIFAHINNTFQVIDKVFTIYNNDNKGISSNYSKFSKNWWKKRNEAFSYMVFLKKKMNLTFRRGPDYFFTKLINLFFLK